MASAGHVAQSIFQTFNMSCGESRVLLTKGMRSERTYTGGPKDLKKLPGIAKRISTAVPLIKEIRAKRMKDIEISAAPKDEDTHFSGLKERKGRACVHKSHRCLLSHD